MRPARVMSTRIRSLTRQVTSAWDHPANRDHRLAALSRLAAFHLRGRVLRRPTRVPIGQHSQMWADLAVVSTIHAVIANPPDWATMQAWKLLLRPGDLFVDIGASAGSYSLWAADLGAKVVAVEPNPSARALLRENEQLNGYRFEIIDAALGQECGTTRFTDQLGTSNHVTRSDQGMQVTLRTLDDLIGDRRVAGVKVDVEGAERLVLEGAETALREHRIAVLQLEWNRASVSLLGEDRGPAAKRLLDHGYTFFVPDDRGRLMPTDFEAFRPDIFAVAPDVTPG
jgi:FkbM family methyltransferase